MSNNVENQQQIAIVTVDEIDGMRSFGSSLTARVDLNVDELSKNINHFLESMNKIISKTPNVIGDFQLTDIEITAEITGKGQVILWGIGGEVGAGGGIKFAFKRRTADL